jgi:hypothetical protein
MFKTEKQFQCIGLDRTNNEGIGEIQRDWTCFTSASLGFSLVIMIAQDWLSWS